MLVQRLLRTLMWSATLIVLAADPALSTGGDSFVVQPAAGSATVSHGGWFQISAQPGDVVAEAVALHNDSGDPVEVHVAAVDARTGPSGGVEYALADEPRTGVARWVELGRGRVTIAPGSAALVPFTVHVPADARSGLHLSGIAVAPTAAPLPAGGARAASVAVHTRRVVPVEVHLPGDAAPRLTVNGVDVAARPDGLYLEIDIANVGRGLTTARGRVSVDGTTRSFDVDTFVPGTAIAYPVHWRTTATSGRHRVRVDLTTSDGAVAVWHGMVEVAPPVQRELDDRRVGGRARSRAVPAGLASVLLTAIVAKLALVVARRRRRPPATAAAWSLPWAAADPRATAYRRWRG
jgi:hypothetical protein